METAKNGNSSTDPAEGDADLPPPTTGSPVARPDATDPGKGNRGRPAGSDNGEARGSGAGAGGGGSPEDYDSDPVGGGGRNPIRPEGPFGTSPADEKRQPPDGDALMEQGPLGDTRPGFDTPDPRTRGGQPAEPVENRPGVGSVTPEDYPLSDRKRATPR